MKIFIASFMIFEQVLIHVAICATALFCIFLFGAGSYEQIHKFWTNMLERPRARRSA